MTLLELVAQATQQLTDAKVSFGHGTTNARDEAAWLVLWALGLPLEALLVGVDAAEAERAGLVSRVVPLASLMDEVLASF